MAAWSPNGPASGRPRQLRPSSSGLSRRRPENAPPPEATQAKPNFRDVMMGQQQRPVAERQVQSRPSGSIAMPASEPNELLDLDLSRVRPERRNGHSSTFRPRHSGALSVGPNVPPPGSGRALATSALTAPTPLSKDRPLSRAQKSAGWSKTKRAVDASAAVSPPVVVALKLPPPSSSETPSSSLTSLGRSRAAKVVVQKDSQRGSFSPRSNGQAALGAPAKEGVENIDSLFGPEDPSPPENLEVSAVGSGSSCNFVAASSRMSRWFVHDEYAEAKIGGTSSFRPDEDLGGLGDDLMAQLDFAANGTGDSNEGEDEPLREEPPNHVQGVRSPTPSSGLSSNVALFQPAPSPLQVPSATKPW